MYGDIRIWFFKLTDDSGYARDFCPETPQTKTFEIIIFLKTPAAANDLCALYNGVKSRQAMTEKPNTQQSEKAYPTTGNYNLQPKVIAQG